MQSRVVLIATAALMIGGSTACSSGHAAANPEPETLPPGAAKLSIDGNDLPISRTVECAPPEEHLTTITTGNDASGATLMVSNAGKLTVELVRIRNLNGFTGDYNRGLGNDATISLVGNTYQISGAAFGYDAKSPQPTTVPFTIEVSC